MTDLPVATVVGGAPRWRLPVVVKLPVDAAHVVHVRNRSAPSLLFEGSLQAFTLLDLGEPNVVAEVIWVTFDIVRSYEVSLTLLQHHQMVLVESGPHLEEL